MASNLIHSTEVDRGGDNTLTRIRVLYYQDGSIRLRVYRTPLVIAEAYLQGGKNDFSIVKLARGKES